MTEATTQFDAIVIGSGISGGWAAKELTEKGLKVLMLERGRMVEHSRDYSGEHTPPWKVPFRGKPLRELYERDYPIQSKVYAFDETNRHFWNNDRENPYDHEHGQFNWFRANVVGGRSLLWGRQVYRFSDLDFEANKKDGHGIDWPIRYKDIAPWYDHVERFIGVSGQAENLPHLPDGEFLPPMEMSVTEKFLKERVEEYYPDRTVTIGRAAHLTKPSKAHLESGRIQCQYRNQCHRGCSFGAYFSTQSSTLPAARATGNLTLKPDSVVAGIDFDPQSRRATGVRVINANTGQAATYTARVIFLCASTVGSTQILLNSRSSAFPSGLANSSGTLGRYLMDHTHGAGAAGMLPGFEDRYVYGARPNGIYIPRFRNLNGQGEDVNFLRGYGYQGGTMRAGWRGMAKHIPGFGAEFKQALRKPGPWSVYISGFGECLPYEHNRMELHPTKTDRFGIPLVRFHFQFGENEANLVEDLKNEAAEMLTRAGAVNVNPFGGLSKGGDAIHEMGTARMGNDPATSVLNRWNQAHDVPNLFVTDGACMTSASCVNPSLTYMALTARAANYAAEQLKAGNF